MGIPCIHRSVGRVYVKGALTAAGSDQGFPRSRHQPDHLACIEPGGGGRLVNLVNQHLVNAVIFLVGLALFGLIAELGIALGLATDAARWLGFGALVAYFLATAIIVQRRRRSAPPAGIQ
jgi:hypothetical protein